MSRIIIVNGAPRVGKSKFVEYCVKELKGFGTSLSTVDLVKEIARKCGWNGKKTEKNRWFLAELKDLLTKWDNVPFKDIEKKINLFDYTLGQYDIEKNQGIVFVMCREPEEIDKFVKKYDAITVLVSKKEKDNVSHLSWVDMNTWDYKYDYIIDNNGSLEDLHNSAVTFLEQLKGE